MDRLELENKIKKNINKLHNEERVNEILKHMGFVRDLINNKTDPYDFYLLNIDEKYLKPIEIPNNLDPYLANIIKKYNTSTLKLLIEMRDLQLEAKQSGWFAYREIERTAKIYEDHIKDKHDCNDECLARIGLDDKWMNESKGYLSKIINEITKHFKEQGVNTDESI
jgi:hypothetical protein